MGAVEHLKALCCVRLPPESAMVAVTPLLHQIIPHGWSRLALVAPNATIANAPARLAQGRRRSIEERAVAFIARKGQDSGPHDTMLAGCGGVS